MAVALGIVRGLRLTNSCRQRRWFTCREEAVADLAPAGGRSGPLPHPILYRPWHPAFSAQASALCGEGATPCFGTFRTVALPHPGSLAAST